MNKKIIAAASFQKQKYFFDSEFEKLPEDIKKEIQVICVLSAQSLECTFVIGFKNNGDVYFEVVDNLSDEIGIELLIKEIRIKHKELLKALKLWYLLYKTNEGSQLKDEFLG